MFKSLAKCKYDCQLSPRLITCEYVGISLFTEPNRLWLYTVYQPEHYNNTLTCLNFSFHSLIKSQGCCIRLYWLNVPNKKYVTVCPFVLCPFHSIGSCIICWIIVSILLVLMFFAAAAFYLYTTGKFERYQVQ